jgi:hypothetical protein
VAALRIALLSSHIAGGLAGLVLGAFALRPFAPVWIKRLYAAALIVLAVFLTATVAVDWPNLGGAQRTIYSVLIALAIVIVARGLFALQTTDPVKYVNHMYFTYISLWEGFFIVGLIDLGAPAWFIAAVAIGVVLIGGVLISGYRRRLVRPA